MTNPVESSNVTVSSLPQIEYVGSHQHLLERLRTPPTPTSSARLPSRIRTLSRWQPVADPVVRAAQAHTGQDHIAVAYVNVTHNGKVMGSKLRQESSMALTQCQK